MRRGNKYDVLSDGLVRWPGLSDGRARWPGQVAWSDGLVRWPGLVWPGPSGLV